MHSAPSLKAPEATDGRSRLGRARDNVRLTARTLGLVYRSSPRGTIGLGALTLAMAVLPLMVAFAGKGIVDAVVARSRALTIRWVLIELGVVALQALGQRALALLRSVLGERLALDINVMILEKAQTLELRHFEDAAFYDRLTRARREASYRPVSVVTETFQLLQNMLTLLSYSALLVRYAGWAVIALLAAALPATLAELRFSSEAFRLRNWRSPEARRQNYLEYVLANDRHVKEVKLFALGQELLGRYRKQGDIFYDEDTKLSVRRATWAFLLSLIGTATFYACYAAMALGAALGRLTLGNMTLYVVAFRQGQQAFQSVLAAIGSMYEDNLYMSNLFEYLSIGSSESAAANSERTAASAGSAASPEATSKITESSPAVPAIAQGAAGPIERGSPASGAEEGIRFEDVGFRYPARGDDAGFALRHIDLYIPKAQSVALVGQNGAGKTTLIKLLTRLYTPTEGRILLDGRDLRDWDVETLRRRVGVIFQDFNEYQFSLRENIGVGSIEHLADELRIHRAAERGGADEVQRTLSAGMDTQLGGWFQKGVELSGGQWQKVALARAFMREEADILVLDEPTAALDAEAEHAIFERFRQLARGRTTFLISHRFPTVRMADRILVLEHGRVIEDGTHQSLLDAGARYAQLFTLQAQGYQ
jgi:ATP-binding cassette subfamily B protein